MSLNPIISVIMPVYNVKDFLENAIECVLAQSFDDFELIIVDDGSTDGSSQICDKYVNTPRVKVFHLENGGVAGARNFGLEKASGKYVAFFDSDDCTEPDMLAKMLECAQNTGAQIVISGFHMEYFENGRQLDYIVSDDDKTYNADEFKQAFYRLLKKNLLSTPWNKLYLKSFIDEHNVRFENILCEDIYFNLDLYANISTISVMSFSPYRWFRSRPGSETDKIYSPDLLWKTKKDVYTALLKLCKKWDLHNNNTYLADITCYYTDRLVQCVQEIMASKSHSRKQKRAYIKTILSDSETKTALKIAKPSSKAMKICYIPLRLGNVTLSAIMGGSISFVKNRFSTLFYNLRSKEVNDSSAG